MVKLNYNLADIPDVPIIPAGRYRLKLAKAEKKLSKTSGNPMIQWTWKLLQGPAKGQTVMTWTSLQENALSGLKEHLIAFGLKGQIKGGTDKLIGGTVLAVIGTRKGKDKWGKEVDVTNVIGVLPDKKLKARDEDEDEEDDDVEDDEEVEEGDENDDEDDEDDDDEDDEEEEEDDD